MNCLPIVDRELRVAARRRSTFWLRVSAAAAALVIGAGCLILNELQHASSAEMGRILFQLLVWLCFAAGLGAGLFFTSDCLSEEKREGTLGLLFLTDLRGYDVTLGKLLATSLRGFYALLAILPIISITQLMGGISQEQYWKSSLALVNALFLSLAAGMLVSAVSRDSQKAMGITLLVLLVLALGGPLADALTAYIRKRAGLRVLWSLSSPGYALLTAGVWNRTAYWQSLGITHAMAWGMLALASALAPRTWQERKGAAGTPGKKWFQIWRFGGRRRQARLRRILLERRPVTWLACRERWQSVGLWALALLAIGACATMLWKAPLEGWMIWHYLGGLFTFLLYLWAASQACRFLVDTRRSGLLELMLATPVTGTQIVRELWQALVRLFAVPLLMLLAVQVTAAALSNVSFQRLSRQVSAMTPAPGTNTNATFTASVSVNSASGVSAGVSISNTTNVAAPLTLKPAPLGRQGVALLTTAGAATAICTAANLLALVWFGMWMGLTSRTANLATLKTLVLVQIVPWFVIAFGTTMLSGIVMAALSKSGPANPGRWFLWWPLFTSVVGAVLALAKDIGFFLWARSRLRSSFREQAAANPGQPREGRGERESVRASDRGA